MTTTNLHSAPAHIVHPASITGPQLQLINSLLVSRAVSAEVIEAVNEKKARLSKDAASKLISVLMAGPRRSRADAPQAAGVGELRKALEELPTGKYALPRFLVEAALRDMKMPNGDLIFVEIRKFRNTLQMVRLVGAPGSFSRYRIPTIDALTLAGGIAQNPYKYTKLFADHYKVCGRCAAELTDQTSRELGLGPVCVKYFNIR